MPNDKITISSNLDDLDRMVQILGHPALAERVASAAGSPPGMPPPPYATEQGGVLSPQSTLSPLLGGPQQQVNPRMAPARPPGGIGHRILSALGRIGDVAGTALVPGAMAAIPGSTIYKGIQERRAREKEAVESEAALRRATAGEATERGKLYGAQVEAGLPAAEASAYRELGAQRGTQAEMLKKSLEALADPETQKDLQAFQDPNATADDLAAATARLTTRFGASPLKAMLTPLEKIYQQREIGGRMGGHVLRQDPATGEFYEVPVSRKGQEMPAEIPTLPPAGMLPQRALRYRAVTDAAGNEYLVPVQESRAPVLPGGAQPTLGGAPPTGGTRAPAPTGAEGLPVGQGGAAGRLVGHKPLSQSAKTQIAAIDTTLGALEQLRGQIDQITAGRKMDQVTDVASKNALWAAYRAGFATQISELAAQVSLDRVLGSLAYMKGTRAYRWIQQIQQHLPKATDSYPLMVEKINNAEATLPWVKYGALVSEGVMRGNAREVVRNRRTGALGMRYPDGSVAPLPF